MYAPGEPARPPEDLRLAHPVRDAQLGEPAGGEAEVGRDGVEQLLDVGQPDGGEHPADVVVGVRRVVHGPRARVGQAVLRRERRAASSSAGLGTASEARSPGSSASDPSTSRTTRPTAIPNTP